MGRLVIGIELILILTIFIITLLGGKADLFLALVPMIFVLVFPPLTALMVWKPGEIIRAFQDAFSMERLFGDFRASLQIWNLMEKSAYLCGIIGIILTGVIFLNKSGRGMFSNLSGVLRIAFLFGLYSILFGILSRILNNTVRFLSVKPVSELKMKLSDLFCDKYHITLREREIIELILWGKQYHEIAESLFISIKTVKTHVRNIYDKTGASGKIDLIRKLQFE